MNVFGQKLNEGGTWGLRFVSLFQSSLPLDTSEVFALMPIYLFIFFACASIKCSVGTSSDTYEQIQPFCIHSYKGTCQNFFLSPSFMFDFRGHLLRKTFHQNVATAPCSLERREKMSCLVHVLLTLLSPAL